MKRSTSAPTTPPDHDRETGGARPAEVEHAYFTRRAAEHRRMADATDKVSSRALHLRFAKAYQDRADAFPLVHQD